MNNNQKNSKISKNRKNIVLHDIFDIKGGGERLAISLANALKADLSYGKHSSNSFNLEEMHDHDRYNLGLKVEFAGLKTVFLSKLFKNKTDFLNNYENVIYSGIICPLAITNHQSGGNFYYCHTPPRFVYDKYQHYMQQYTWPQKILLKLLVSWLKPQYERSIALMDVVFANSEFVKARIKKYLNRDSVVIYPPCQLGNFNHDKQQGYYLSTARFDPLKRVDVIIKAFIKMPEKKLVLCSTGSQATELKKLAGNAANISFVGMVSDAKLSELISQCIATIYIPTDEDFGMSPVESMAAGKPVICSGHGGPTESIIDGETGFYINENNPTDSLIENTLKMDANTSASMQVACENKALMFSEANFHKKIQESILR